jgi:uncharacterized protein (DUF362 family)
MVTLSKVVIVRAGGSPRRPADIPPETIARMYERGLRLLMDQPGAAEAVRSIFTPSDRVGIKINGIAAPEITTGPAVSLPLARLLTAIGIPARNIVVWDRTNRELRDAGYKLNQEARDVQVYGTDTAGAGYAGEPTMHRSIASLFSSILADRLTASVSLAVLKDHGMAGVTAGLKNYFGAIHNPNKYHDDHCDPFAAELFDSPPVRTRHRLTILDALVVQCHRGPSYHPRWAEPEGALVFSLDPVAADAVGWRMIERLRAAKGLPSLEEDGRPPLHILTAEKLGLGRAGAADIRLIEETVS